MPYEGAKKENFIIFFKMFSFVEKTTYFSDLSWYTIAIKNKEKTSEENNYEDYQ